MPLRWDSQQTVAVLLGLYFDLRPYVCPYVRPSVHLSVRGQRFLRSVWVNWFETLGQEQVWSEDYARQIDFDIIQNGGLAAILDVNRLGAVTPTTPTGLLSNLVQRERLGWPTCMPIYFLFDLKNGDMAAIFVF